MVTINNQSIANIDIVNSLKKDVQYKEVWQRILNQKVIEKAAQERGITVSPEEIQVEGDRLRMEKKLYKVSDTMAWFAEQMITVEDLEAGIGDRLLSQKLAEHLFKQEVEKFFAQNRLNFQEILLYQIIIREPRFAQEIYYQIKEQEISFYDAAHCYDIDEKRRQVCGYEGNMCRWSLKPEIAAAVFSAKPGVVISPIKTAQGYHILMVEKFIQGELTQQRYQEILNNMFRQWLAREVNYMLYNQIEPESSEQLHQKIA
ncbi:MAG: peptidylprolyl isomerase [Okeania sp. SIO3I5]|uniref:peptidylprolyl isomerase n=1 Tax=Okeania sp. SIO3I5 TaxID=2607805 RepID=UPI0013BB8678|nr:peptidylprolyl isomerase [Okeania sp. SIO3I5]NEQ40700.1 peptidylprolyl isomerase [Okeania sp. SIO3I5]